MIGLNSLAERDRVGIWHPYTQELTSPLAIPIVKAEGVYLYDDKGKTYIDAISSWWVNMHGHGNEYLAEAIYNQFKQIDHIIFAGFTHEPAVRLAEKLISLLPSFSKVFYSDNGSTAVEVALKMCFQYWKNNGKPKTKIIAFNGAYHGDTFGAMSVSERGPFNEAFSPFLFDVLFIDPPTDLKRSNAQLKDLLKQHEGEIAGFIFEPLVMGAAGMVMYAPSALDELMDICKQNHILTIADEVMTGFGRTGKMFAIDSLASSADIICLSKGISGGVLPLGATLCSDFIYKCFLSKEYTKTFFHGHSYTGNALTCALGIASLDLFISNSVLNKIQGIHQQHLDFAKKLKPFRNAQNVRVTGTIFAFEVETKEDSTYFNSIRNKIYNYFLENGILLRPLGNTIYILPPYIITEAQLNEIYSAIENFLTELSA